MFRFLMTALFSQVVFSQFQISKKDTTYVYNLNSFRGTGLNPSPTDQLDSDDWATAGISGTTAFGATNTDAALSRGATTGGVGNTGGLYAYHVSGSSHYAILIRPTNSVFNTGSITLRVENNTSEPIVNLRFAYDIRVNNNNNHSHSLNFSYSTDNSTYTSISALNYSSPQASDGNGVVFAATKKDTITNLYIAAGGYVYLRWSGANVSGNGQYDELILDSIKVQMVGLASEPTAQATNLSLTNATQSSLDVSFTAASPVPTGYIVLRQASSAPVDVPIDTTTYIAGDIIGTSTVAYVGAGTSFTDNSLATGTSYYYAVFSYNYDGYPQTENYLITSPLTGNAATLSGNMSVTTITTTQNTNIVLKGQTDQQVIGIQIQTSGNSNPLSLTNLYLRTTGTSSPGTDILNAKIYSTGTSSTFATGTKLGSTVSSPNGLFNFSSSLTLSQGTNYLWLTYDINPSATDANLVDAVLDSVRISSTKYTPVNGAPTGSRQIFSYCQSFSNSYAQEYISRVVFSTVDNSSVGTSYTDYSSSKIATVYRNNSYTLSVTILAATKERIFAWVDWNNDGDFADSGEEYDFGVNTSSSGPHSISISVPSGATLGTTRMRVSLKQNQNPTSCENFSRGEVEDYGIQILAETQMTYTSSTTTQNSEQVNRGVTNQQIISMQIVMTGTGSAQSVSAFNLSTTGTTNTADITNARVYYTGTSSTFATTTQFGIKASPSGSYQITGNQTLVAGTNYFWLAYDVSASATYYNNLDAVFSSAVINSVTRTPSVTAPSGSRKIDHVYLISGTTVTDSTGVLYDNGGATGDYLNGNTTISFVVSPTGANYIKFSFSSFNFASGDEVRVYDGPTTGSAQISGSPFTGSTLPNNGQLYTSSGGSILIQQITDNSTSSAGFKMSWTSYKNANMAYSSSTTSQNSNDVGIGFTNQDIIGIVVTTSGNQSPISLTQLNLNTNGTNSVNLDAAKVFYTGLSSTFATTTQFGSTVSNPNGNFTVNGSQTLQAGDNYFWVTYDINANSAPGQTVDASVVSMVVNSISRVPTVTSPSGSRSIQFVQGFETAVPPTGWTILNSSGTNWSRNTTVSFNGTSSAEAARTGTGDRYLITPQVLPTLSNHTLKFWARKHASAGSNEGSLHIRVSTTDGQIASFVNTVNTFNVNSLTTEWSLQSVDLSAYQDTQIYIALVHDPDGANVGGLYIDDVQHPSESQDLLFTGLSSSTIGITDAQKNVILNRFIATAASSFTIDSIEFSEVAGGNLQFIDSLRLYNGTAVIARSGYPNLSLNFDISSYSINSGDTLILNADFRSVFSLSYDYQFNVSSLSKIYISGGETITNANFPLTGNLLQNTVIVTANAANPASQPNLNAGVRAWLGSFTLSNSDGLNNTLNSITIQNRVNIGSVSASDIDSVLIYATSALTPTLSSSPTASALFTDDGFGGTGTVTLNPSTSMSGINYHIVYKLSSSRSASNSFGVKVTSISLDSSMSIINLPLSFLTDYTLPVKINHFSAIPGKNWIDLKIITASEPDLSVLEIERHELNTNKFEQIALIELKGNVSSGAEYIHRDNITEPGKRYRYTIYELFLDGSRVKQDLDVEAEVEIPSQFRLGNAYPNPFNPSTRIDFSLPEKSRISIQIYNLLGQLVKEYQQIDLNAGNHYQVWDGRNNVGSNVATGIYYLKFGWTGLDSGQHRSNVLKLVYLK